MFVIAMIRMTLAKSKAKRMGYKHIIKLPRCCSLSQLPNLSSIMGSLIIIIILLCYSIHNHDMVTEGESTRINLFIFAVDYTVQTLTVFILLFVVRKTANNLLMKEKLDRTLSSEVSCNNFSEIRFEGSDDEGDSILSSEHNLLDNTGQFNSFKN